MDVKPMSQSTQPIDLTAKRHRITAKRTYSQETSQPRDLTAKRSHSQEISQPRNLTAKGSHSQETSHHSQRSHSQGISQPRDLTAKRTHSQEISQPRDLTAKRSHSQETSQPRNLTESLLSHLQLSVFERIVSQESFVFTSSTYTFSGKSRRKALFHIFHFHFFKDASHESFVFTSSAFTFWRKSRPKVRFHIFHFQFLRDVSHEMRFWETADARNAVLQGKKKGVPEERWGSLSSGRLRNTFICTGIILGSAAQWNCQFRLHFHNLNFQNLKEVSHASFVFTSSTFRFWGDGLAPKLRFHIFHFPILRGWSCTKASFSHLPLSDFEGIVSHKSFVFTSSAFTFWRTSRAKCVFEW